A
ncbi:putative membrane protein, partial [Escherichia coli 99.0672]